MLGVGGGERGGGEEEAEEVVELSPFAGR